MDTIETVKDTEHLIKLISESGTTISNREIKKVAEQWVANYHSDLLNVLGENPRAIKAIQYLVNSVNNQRLTKRRWVKNLKFIIKSLKKLRLRKEERISVLDPNQPFTVYLNLKKMFAKAKKEILIYDGYVDRGTLDILSEVKKDTILKILTNNTYGKFLRELPKFTKEFPNCEVKKSNIVHDRFFLIDGRCFLCGTSLHSLGGRKPSYIFQVDKKIANIFREHFDAIWSKAAKTS